MRFSIFKPTSKVHMQRDVMREVDERLAKYSRRGIFLSLVLFSLCMVVGQYYQQEPEMALVLLVGLLFITLVRSYFLFKFDQLYAQAPTRWRNIFFFASLLGSSWWGFMLANVTYVNGLTYETPVLWLYTVAFFASSLYVFAPFERFFSIYMLVSFIPCAAVAIAQLEPTGVLYGIIMIALYFMLRRQGRIVGKNYWDKLQATYQLMQRANALEAEKITTESSLNSRDSLFNRVTHELKAGMQEVLDSLQLLKYSQLANEEEQLVLLSEQKTQQQINLLKNVAELSNISSDAFVLDEQVADLRYHIEQTLNSVSGIAHKKQVEIYSSFSHDFPMRVKVDIDRLEQLIGNLMISACQFADSGELVAHASFRFDVHPNILKLSLINRKPIHTPETVDNIASIFSPQYAHNVHLGLSLSIVKSLAESMGGNAGADYHDDGSLVFWSNIQLDTIASSLPSQQVVPHFEGKKLLLFRPPEIVAKTFQETLESWGLRIDATNDENEALETLEGQHKSNPYHGVILCTGIDDLSALSLSAKLAEHPKLWSLVQIMTLTKLQNKLPEIEAHFSKYTKVEVLYKPLRYRRLRKMLKSVLHENTRSPQAKAEANFLENKTVVLFQQEDIDLAILKAMLKKLGCQVVTALSIEESLDALSNHTADVFICESHLGQVDIKSFIDEAKKVSITRREDKYKIPVLGYTSRELEGEEGHCLACGMDYYIDSPTNIDDLRAILRRFIGRAIYLAENY